MSNEPRADLSIPRMARLAALVEARRRGWLAGRTLQEIGNLLGVNRSTVMRNLRQLDEYERASKEFLKRLKP